MVRVVTSLVVALLVVGPVADVSSQLRYEGTLVSPAGDVFADGTYWVVFAVYDPQDGSGKPVAVESQVVDLSGGKCCAELDTDANGTLDGGAYQVVPLQVLPAAEAACGCSDAVSQDCNECRNADMVDRRHATGCGNPQPGYLYPLHADRKFPNTVLRTGSGNRLDADTVDGIHASGPPRAGRLYPLAGDRKFPNRVLRTGHGNGLDADMVDGKHASDFATGTHDHDDDYVNEGGDTMTGPLESTVPGGTAPISVVSQTVCPNLNADLLDGNHASDFATGTHDHDDDYVNEAGDTMSGPLESAVAEGTAPISVASTTECPNLNAALLNGLTAQDIAGMSGVPSGTIVMWSGTTIPDGWHRFSALDGLFPRGAATYGGTGGSETHTHTYDGITSRVLEDSGPYKNVGGGDNHHHSYSGTTDPSSSLPPYLDIIFIPKD